MISGHIETFLRKPKLGEMRLRTGVFGNDAGRREVPYGGCLIDAAVDDETIEHVLETPRHSV